MTAKDNTSVTEDNSVNKKVFDPPIGITDPPIDELLEHVTSKYALVIFAAKRARQINSYNQQANEVFEFVGPLVSQRPREKPLSIALREINEGLLEHKEG